MLASFWLFIVLLFSLIEFRLLGGRATIGLFRVLLAFSYGAVGATILSIITHRLALFLLDNNVIAWSVGPAVEELTKAVPVLLLAYGFAGRRRLTVADYTLIGFASGAGFSFVETNLRTVYGGGFSPLTLASLDYWLAEPVLKYQDTVVWAAGHSFWTAFTGLGVGIGVRLWPGNPLRLAPAVAAAALVWLEHAVTNWKAVHTEYFFGQIQSIARAPDWIEALFAADLQGRLIMLLLPSLLLAATIVEGLWVGRTLNGRRESMLPDEGPHPLVLREWIALVRAVPRGRAEFVRMTRYFRRRRELDLTSAEAGREIGSTDLRPVANYLERLVMQERTELAVPMPARWLPAPGMVVRSLIAFLRRRWLLLTVLALVVVLFMIAPAVWPDWLRGFLFGPIFSFAIMIFSVALLTWRVRAFVARGWPDPERTDCESLASHRLRAGLLFTSTISLGFSIVAWFLSRRALAPETTAYITNAWIDWLNHGGGPELISLGALAGAAAADPDDPDPCTDLRREAELGDARIKELERRAKDWKRPEPPPDGWPSDRPSGDPATSKLFDDNWLRQMAGAAARTAVGKRIVTVCKPIMGPGGQILGYAMTQEEVDDLEGASGGAPAGDDPSTISLPGGRRLHVDPFEEWLTGTSTVQETLDAERALQRHRLAALAGCEQVGGRTRARDAVPPAPAVKPDLGKLQDEIDAAKKEFEELEKQLHEAVGKDLNAIQNFLKEYDKRWKDAVDSLGRCVERYKDMAPDYKKILEQFAGRDQALRYAHVADEAYRELAAVIGPELLPGGALAAGERAAASAAGRAAGGAASVERAVTQGEAAAGEAAAGEAAAGEAAAARAAEQAASESSMLQPGAAGQQDLDRLLGGFKSTQNKVYVDTVNQYSKQMASGTFDWSKIPEGERIVLNGNVVVSGHHRFVAAAQAARATGRPLMNAPNAVIPSEGFADASTASKIVGTGARDVREWNQVGVVEGAKPPRLVQTVDSDLQAIRDATLGDPDM